MKNLRITVNGTSYDVQVEELSAGAAPAPAAPAKAAAPAPAPKAAAPASGEPVKSPMPGVILDITCFKGNQRPAFELCGVCPECELDFTLRL